MHESPNLFVDRRQPLFSFRLAALIPSIFIFFLKETLALFDINYRL